MSKSFGELADTEFRPREEILGPWMQKGRLILLFATRGIGKTFFSLQVAHSVATQTKFLKWTPIKRRRVVLFDGEMGFADLKERLLAIDKAAETSCQGNFIKICSFEEHGTRMPNLSTVEGQAYYDKESEGHDLIIIDNLLTCAEPMNNRDDELSVWRRIQDWAIRVRLRGQTVLFIHHAGKSGLQLGTSTKEAVMDTIISLKRPAQTEVIEGFEAELHFEKTRGFFGESAQPLYFKMIDAPQGPVWTWFTLRDKQKADIIELGRTGAKPHEIAKEFNMPKFMVNRILTCSEERELPQDYHDQDLF